jgi:hypothetical protein
MDFIKTRMKLAFYYNCSNCAHFFIPVGGECIVSWEKSSDFSCICELEKRDQLLIACLHTNAKEINKKIVGLIFIS